MLLSAIEDADGPESLEAAYRDRLREAVETGGTDAVAEATGLDAETVEALAAGEPVPLELTTAAEILACDPEARSAEAIRLETLDELLLGMTTAVVDVETVAANVEPEMDPKGVQQRLEGRATLTLAELAGIHWFLHERAP